MAAGGLISGRRCPAPGGDRKCPTERSQLPPVASSLGAAALSSQSDQQQSSHTLDLPCALPGVSAGASAALPR